MRKRRSAVPAVRRRARLPDYRRSLRRPSRDAGRRRSSRGAGTAASSGLLAGYVVGSGGSGGCRRLRGRDRRDGRHRHAARCETVGRLRIDVLDRYRNRGSCVNASPLCADDDAQILIRVDMTVRRASSDRDYSAALRRAPCRIDRSNGRCRLEPSRGNSRRSAGRLRRCRKRERGA